jgi:hypothetical protein
MRVAGAGAGDGAATGAGAGAGAGAAPKPTEASSDVTDDQWSDHIMSDHEFPDPAPEEMAAIDLGKSSEQDVIPSIENRISVLSNSIGTQHKHIIENVEIQVQVRER